MDNRPNHPNKDIERAIKFAEKNEWIYQAAGNSAHCWGKLMCPHGNRDGCKLSIWSTPKSAENHAKQIRRKVKQCPH